MKATILLVLALALSPLLAPSAFAENDQKSTPAGLVDALNGVFGKQTDNRAVHAKGIVLEGKFTPSPEAAALSKAPHLQGTAVPVTVRFSDFAGVPAIPDSDPNASPRGMAVKFHLPDGSDTNIVTHSYNGFPTATADEFQIARRQRSRCPKADAARKILRDASDRQNVPDRGEARAGELRHAALFRRQQLQIHRRQR
jgi:catalase